MTPENEINEEVRQLLDSLGIYQPLVKGYWN